jgi:hypothetical protein
MATKPKLTTPRKNEPKIDRPRAVGEQMLMPHPNKGGGGKGTPAIYQLTPLNGWVVVQFVGPVMGWDDSYRFCYRKGSELDIMVNLPNDILAEFEPEEAYD